MTQKFSLPFAALAVALFAMPPLARAQDSNKPTLDGWPASAKKAAQETMDKYGPPQAATPTRLIWTDKGPFKEIIAFKEEQPHNMPVPHKDSLEDVVRYDVPVDKVGDLAKFDGSVIVDRTWGTLAARCDSEAHNIMALNLADKIIHGQMNVQEARMAYAKAAKQAMNGQMPTLGQKLEFQPPAHSGEPDKMIKMNSMNSQPPD